jgi:uncharacterized membrane protein YcaP (DUF421 family)
MSALVYILKRTLANTIRGLIRKPGALIAYIIIGLLFLTSAYEPATPSNLQLSVEPFELPRIIVKEGIINYDELKKINKDANWVISNLKRSYSAEVKDVLLATFDNSCNLKVFLYR